MRQARVALIPVGLFLLVFVTHLSGVGSSSDSRWSIPTARSVLYQHNTDLDEYPELLAKNKFWAIEMIDGHYYSIFPLGAPLLAIPVVAFVDATGIDLSSTEMENVTASLVVALTATLLFHIGRRSLKLPGALLIALIFAFCTAAWSTASRVLWQHGPSMLMLTLALWLIVLAERRPWMVQFASLPLAYSYVVRPTNAVSIAFLTLFVLVRHRSFFVRYLLWGLLVAIPFAAFSLTVYHWPVPLYYSPGRVGHGSALLEALAGNLVSPARGLFVFSPVLLFSVYGAWLRLRYGPVPLLDGLLVAIVIVHWVVISSFQHWWGGHSFGYRLFSDMVPYLMYFLIPVIGSIPALAGRRRVAFLGLLGGLVAASLFINYRGATKWDVVHWNRVPVDVDIQPSRVWDWRDASFLRGLLLWHLAPGSSWGGQRLSMGDYVTGPEATRGAGGAGGRAG